MGFKELALEYAEQGFAVFPLAHHGKIPAIPSSQGGQGCNEATTDPVQIDLWWTERPFANVGIATGDLSGGIAVIDLDIKPEKGIDGDLSLKEWESKHGAFPDTVCATTGSGGRHLYYKVDKPFPSARGILDGVDVRCNGGYVVAPGSIHENGNEYIWDISPEDAEIANANSSVYALLEKIASSVNETAFKSPNRIASGARTDTLFKLACSLQAKGLADAAIKAAIITENAEKCEPPLTEKELEREVFGALSRYEKGPTPKTTATPKKEKEKVQSLVAIPANKIAEMELQPITFRVNTILADGVTILAAASKYYKSWMCLQLAIAVANGTHFLGYPTQQCDVLYLDLENDIRVTQDRLKKVLHGATPPENLLIVNECARMGSGFEDQITEILEQNPNIGLVIIDVLQYVKYNRTSNQTDYECDYKTFKFLKSLIAGKPLSIVCVHHTRKMKDDADPFSNMLGSTALMGATDEEIVIHKAKRSDHDATISITGRTVQATDLIGYFDIDKWQWVIRGTQEELYNTERESAHQRNGLTVLLKKHLLKDQSEWKGKAKDILTEAEKHGIKINDFSGNHIVNYNKLGEFLHSQKLIDNLMTFDKVELTQIWSREFVFKRLDGFDSVGDDCELPFIEK